jgi:hypothetical protein
MGWECGTNGGEAKYVDEIAGEGTKGKIAWAT